MIASIELTEIDLRDMTPVKATRAFHNGQDHCRWVFKDAGKNRVNNSDASFFKVWNPAYVRRDNLLQALEAGFYDATTTPALKAILCHRGLCRGYVMDQCHADFRMALDERFFATVKERSRATGFFNVQFSPCHVMRYREGFSLIDLDGVFPLRKLTEIYKEIAYFDYKDYENFMVAEYDRTMPDGLREKFSAEMKNRRYFRTIHPVLRIGQAVWQKLTRPRPAAEGSFLDMIEY